MTVYLARFTGGGPLDGTVLGLPGPWPLPDDFTATVPAQPRIPSLADSDQREGVIIGPTPLGQGRYVKHSQSQLTEDIPNVARGAEYVWEPA